MVVCAGWKYLAGRWVQWDGLELPTACQGPVFDWCRASKAFFFSNKKSFAHSQLMSSVRFGFVLLRRVCFVLLRRLCFVLLRSRAHSTIATPKKVTTPLPLFWYLFYGSCRQCILYYSHICRWASSLAPPASSFLFSLVYKKKFAQLVFNFFFLFLANQTLSPQVSPFFSFQALQGLDVSFMLAITIVLPTFCLSTLCRTICKWVNTILHTLLAPFVTLVWPFAISHLLSSL